ncbi:MAG: hypothetical protein ACRDOB_04245 [Streptosporangiaceae bacterium]
MNEHDDVMCRVRESFSGLSMERPVENVFAASRIRRRRRRSALTAAAAAVAGAATALTLTLGGPGPARSGNPPPPSQSPVQLAAFSVTSGPRHTTTLILYKGPQYHLDPSALRQALARHGIPALVTVGTFCRSGPTASSGVGKVVNASNQADGSAIVINGQAMPPGTRLSIGLFPGYTRMLLIKDGAPLSCSSRSRQPAAHIPPSGTPIRGDRVGNDISG